jgi:hypothetical protein
VSLNSAIRSPTCDKEIIDHPFGELKKPQEGQRAVTTIRTVHWFARLAHFSQLAERINFSLADFIKLSWYSWSTYMNYIYVFDKLTSVISIPAYPLHKASPRNNPNAYAPGN